ncbi:MAG: hypothetical protein BWY74_00963 [Firmicutes bacterium ADurb.Bin419]|nr:MAG: hypothetical protein BWY74_00963 [Firmicutes bacterium ADurb.Bin419]
MNILDMTSNFVKGMMIDYDVYSTARRFFIFNFPEVRSFCRANQAGKSAFR